MTYEILLSGSISPWGISAEFITEELRKADGAPVLFKIGSPGGSAYEGLKVSNLIKAYSGKTTGRIIGLAASMATYLVMAMDEREAEDDAVFMIHNPYGTMAGDYRESEKFTRQLKGLTSLIAKRYSERTGMSIEEAKKAMDDETFYYGDEILKAGFVDRINGTDRQKDKKASIEQAAVEIQACLSELKAENAADFDKIAAMLPEQGEPKAETPVFKGYPISTKAWDSTAADKRLRAKTGSQEKPSASYKNAFFWYDPADSGNFKGYKLPFVDVENGQFVAVRNGVNAAYAAMQGARGGVSIPVADRAAVNSHIEKYREKIKKMKSEEKMTLIETLSENPELQAEFTAAIESARKEGADKVRAEIKQVKNILVSDAYDSAVKETGLDALTGEISLDSFMTFVAVEDRRKEAAASAAAAGETDDLGGTPPVEPEGADGVNNGRAKSPTDIKQIVAEMKAKKQ